MLAMKKAYVATIRAAIGTGGFEWVEKSGAQASAYGWRRWVSSLLAIHDVERMIELDLPWWNVAATRAVEEHLKRRRNARVFEYGAGGSTAWLARRAGEVFSVEHAAGWHKLIGGLLAASDNVTLSHRELSGEGYVGAIHEAGGKFDLIVIDGRRRLECLDRARAHLAPQGLILFDDSGRTRYRKGIANCGLQERRYFGRSYCVPYPDFTSVLYG